MAVSNIPAVDNINEAIFFNNQVALRNRAVLNEHILDQGKANSSNPENDGKFSIFQAFKKFVSGIFSPITALFKNPLQAGLLLIGGIALITLVPSALPLLIAFGVGFGAYQVVNGFIKMGSCLTQGKLDDAERAFHDVGAGTSSILLSYLGARGGAATALRAKATASAIRGGRSLAASIDEGMKASELSRTMTRSRALLECFSMPFTRSGLRALFYDLSPRSIFMNGKLALVRMRNFVNVFKEIRQRWKMTDDEILKICKDPFDELATEILYENIRFPQLELSSRIGIFRLAGYEAQTHKIIVNPIAVRLLGRGAIEKAIAHELQHAQRAVLIRIYLSDAEVKQMVANVINSESPERTILMNVFGSKQTRIDHISQNVIPRHIRNTWFSNDITIHAPLSGATIRARSECWIADMVETIEANININPMVWIARVMDQISKARASILARDPNLANAVNNGSKLAALRLRIRLMIEGIKIGFRNDGMRYYRDYLISPEEILARGTAARRQTQTFDNTLSTLTQRDLSSAENLEQLYLFMRQKQLLDAEMRLNSLCNEYRFYEMKLRSNPNDPELLASYNQVLNKLNMQIRVVGRHERRLILPNVASPLRFNPAFLGNSNLGDY